VLPGDLLLSIPDLMTCGTPQSPFSSALGFLFDLTLVIPPNGSFPAFAFRWDRHCEHLFLLFLGVRVSLHFLTRQIGNFPMPVLAVRCP